MRAGMGGPRLLHEGHARVSAGLFVGTDRERAKANAGLLENHNGTLVEGLFDRGQVGEEQRCLGLRAAVADSADEDEGGFAVAPQGEECGEIGVCRNNDALLAGSAGKDFAVVGGPKAIVAHVDGIVSVVAEPFSEERREGIVDEEPRGTDIGKARSRTVSAA